MALPTIVINSGTGSDSAASGAGPSTAITGVLAATHTNTTVNITDAVALGSVLTNGSAALWINTGSGRQWSGITAISGSSGAWVVTVANAYTATTSGQTWGIGGQRASMAGSAQLFVDWQLGWIVDVQTGETISATITMTGPTVANTALSPIITSTTFTTWGTQPLIQTATNSTVMFKVGTTGLTIRNLSFKNTATTRSDCFQALSASGVNITWSSCIFDGFVQAINGSNNVPNQFSQCILESSEVKNCTGTSGSPSAVSFNEATGGACQVINCYIHSNVSALYMSGSTAGSGGNVYGNVFANNSAGTPVTLSPANVSFINNTVYNCGAGTTLGAITFTGTPIGVASIENNIFASNAGYAIAIASSGIPTALLIRNNAYYSNNGNGTGLDLLTISKGLGDITLTASPFVSTSTPDFGLNSTAGGGTACKGKAATVPNASANTAGDLGAIPSGGGGSGGASGGLINLGMRGGFTD